MEKELLDELEILFNRQKELNADQVDLNKCFADKILDLQARLIEVERWKRGIVTEESEMH